MTTGTKVVEEANQRNNSLKPQILPKAMSSHFGDCQEFWSSLLDANLDFLAEIISQWMWIDQRKRQRIAYPRPSESFAVDQRYVISSTTSGHQLSDDTN